MTVPAAPGHSSWCDACMGSQRCWVCDGAGSVDRRWETADCPSCLTTGRCRYCGRGEEPQATSIVLDPPAESAAAGAPEGTAQG